MKLTKVAFCINLVPCRLLFCIEMHPWDLADGNFSNGYVHHLDLDSKGWKAFPVLAPDTISSMYVAIFSY